MNPVPEAPGKFSQMTSDYGQDVAGAAEDLFTEETEPLEIINEKISDTGNFLNCLGRMRVTDAPVRGYGPAPKTTNASHSSALD